MTSKKKQNRKKIFTVFIQITSNEWNYKNGDIVIMHVYTNSEYNAEKKIDTLYFGSEFPEYKILSMETNKDFLFKDII